ncbi:GntR family transcriptional regulator [Actinomyces radicidentis]|uniref:GntR family transcriptional regulator n=1 Tax=Actinomyces radicidentis TaxID=111015 RepID=UPI0026DF063A|nr:GntR family transcriptional regulator [Actinomyces radicidentis]
MTLSITLDSEDPTPPYEQLRRQLATLIESGALDAGARLPPVRQLAGDLRIAPGTVARTYKELEAAGLVRTRRGAGTTVAPGRRVPGRARTQAIADAAAQMVAAARRLGADDAEIRDAVAAALATGSRS